MITTVNVKFKNGTQKRKEKGLQAIEALNLVLNSQRFKNEVLKMKFTSNQGLTSEQIFTVLMSGAEKLNPLANYSWDFEIKFYTKNLSKVVGYTYPSITYINCNTKFFDKYSPAEIAGHFTHEYCHKLGFGHKSAKEKTSVPYAIGYLIRDLIKEGSNGKSL